ncbi:transposase [Streptomyces avermitilis]|uniref:transposase n=1 Tax=Streptomyces avermitilis TaxID=33903 RepID=UPI0033F8DBCC
MSRAPGLLLDELDPRREIVDAIRYVVDTGCKWRALPRVDDALKGRQLEDGIELKPPAD